MSASLWRRGFRSCSSHGSGSRYDRGCAYRGAGRDDRCFPRAWCYGAVDGESRLVASSTWLPVASTSFVRPDGRKHLAGLVFPACGAPRVGEGAGALNTLRVALPDGHG